MNAESFAPPQPHRISLVGEARDISCAPNQDVLHAAIRAGVDWMRVGCRGGGCGVCRVIVRSGEYAAGRMSKRHVDGGDGPERYALACRVYPVSDLTIELAPLVTATAPSLKHETGGSHGN